MATWDNIIQAVQVFGVDGTVVGNTEIFLTPDNGENFYATMVQFVSDEINAVGTPPTVSVGDNSPNFDSIVAATALTGFSAGTGVVRTEIPKTNALSIGQVVSVKVRVSVAAVATAFVFRVVLFGYYNATSQ